MRESLTARMQSTTVRLMSWRRYSRRHTTQMSGQEKSFPWKLDYLKTEYRWAYHRDSGVEESFSLKLF